MRRVFKSIAIVLLVLVVLWLAIAAWLHLRGPDDTQAAALATLSVKLPPLASERNVADAGRLQGHVVPAEQRTAALETVRAHDARQVTLLEQGKWEPSSLAEDPLEAYPVLPDVDEESPALCARREACLARVRADPDATAALLQQHAQRVRDALALADNDGFRLDRAPSVFMPFAIPSDDRNLALTALASRFVQGDTAGALVATCRDLAGWRRIAANSDAVIGSMVAAAHAEQAVRLLAELVAAIPAGEALPPECASALAPTTDAELDLCPAMGMEFAQLLTVTDVEPQPDTTLRDRVMLRGVNRERMAYLLAPHYAQFCGEAILAQARADTSFAGKVWSDFTCPRWQFAFDPIDCILVDITGATHEHYATWFNRRLDLAAEVALLRTAVWLRDTDADPRPREQRLRERPASLGLRRDVKLEGDSLVMGLYDTRHAPTLRLPLPSRAVAVATTP